MLGTANSTKNSCGNLKTTKVRTPHFYLTHKVHKKYIAVWPLVLLIVMQVKSSNSRITIYNHTQKLYHPMFKTTDFIKKKLEAVKDKSKDSILVYLEVQALYTNSLNHEGIEGVKETLNHQAS